MELFLLRHGDAISQASDDASRELSDLGEHQASIAGRALLQLRLRPHIVLSSPLVRARQTAAIVMRELGIDAVETTEYLTPTADPRQLFEELAGYSQPSVLCVGHLPSLQIAASLLVGGTRDAGLRVGTGTLIGVETPSRLGSGTGVLKWLFSYEQMKEMVRERPDGRH